MPWSKIGDFNAFSGNENYPNQCQFSNKKSSVISVIYLAKFKTGEQSISVGFCTYEQAERFKEMLSTVDDIGYIGSPIKDVYNNVKIFNLDPLKLSAFMKHLRELEPNLIELRNQIFQTLGFDPALGVTLEDLKEIPFEKAVKQVLELQENKIYELSYELLIIIVSKLNFQLMSRRWKKCL